MLDSLLVICFNPVPGDILTTTIISSVVSTNLITGIVVAGCVIFSVMMVLSDERRWPTMALLNRSLTAFTVPLLFLFAYITILWGANVLAG